ncbi:PREDICTED: LIM domain-binding protein 1-like, partial [Priapulus caudatus]|uniref:LIM domain-binding protein 1-like n=1 Tax=Priapulus caudatus TaxID=37621 RepID=A0ABM1ESE7_PRICU
VCTEGRLILEFTFDDLMENSHLVGTLDVGKSALCVILEPMQELMSRHKAYALNPRDCLKTTLFQKWQRMVAPPESQRPPSKRRKRKSSTGTNAAPGAGPGSGGKKSKNNSLSPGPQTFALSSQDVMVVGEPSLMGGEFGDEDERLITRLENTQYEPSNGIDDADDYAAAAAAGAAPTMTSAGSWPGGQDRKAGAPPAGAGGGGGGGPDVPIKTE